MKNNPAKFVTISTVGIDQTQVQLKDGTISIWDFAGQLEYTVTHQYFLSSEVNDSTDSYSKLTYLFS